MYDMVDTQEVVRSHVRWINPGSSGAPLMFNITRRHEDQEREGTEEEDNNAEDEESVQEPNEIINENANEEPQPDYADNRDQPFIYYFINQRQGTYRRISMDEILAMRNRNNPTN